MYIRDMSENPVGLMHNNLYLNVMFIFVFFLEYKKTTLLWYVHTDVDLGSYWVCKISKTTRVKINSPGHIVFP